VTTQPGEFFPEEIIAVAADVAADLIDQDVTLTQWMQTFGRATAGAVCFVKAGGTRAEWRRIYEVAKRRSRSGPMTLRRWKLLVRILNDHPHVRMAEILEWLEEAGA
jgi:hypothetical protein